MSGILKHSATMRIKIVRLAKLLEQRDYFDFHKSLNYIYNSNVFSDLDDEETKIWHYSDETLYDLLKQEKTSGKADYPDV
ncbi:MAG: hypothetical protein FWC26_15330 [Fibromonadales bacterium]|nr:hypothetical protein [Fibromonadales bacterium]